MPPAYTEGSNPISEPALTAFQFYKQQQFSAVRAFVAQCPAAGADDFGLLFLDGLAACRMGDLVAGIRQIKAAKNLFPEIEDFYVSEPFNRQRGMVAVADHMEANFIQYCQTFDTDNFLISYPKCGRTWIRIVLGKFLLGDAPGNPIELTELTAANREMPLTVVTHDDGPHLIPHDDITMSKKAYAGKRVAFLVRDPRDVMVSNFFQYSRRGDSKLINSDAGDMTLSQFIRSDIGGLPSLIRFYNAWAENKGIPAGYEVFFYEDFHAEPMASFDRIVDFLGLRRFGKVALEQAVEFGRFENLQKAETSDVFNDVRLRAADPTDPESRKIRKGKVGGFIDYLDEADIRYCDDLIDAELHQDYARYKQS